MSDQTENLKVGLLDNGGHSLRRGYEMWSQWKKSEDAWLLKEAVMWVHHGIELVLKQLLVQTNEFLVFQDVNKAVERLGILRNKHKEKEFGVLDLFDNDDKVMSVGFSYLIERVAIAISITELERGQPLRSMIDKLTRYRNKIVHFSVELDVVEVSGLLSELLNPLLSILSREINDNQFKNVVIPNIRKLAHPIQEYLENIRGDIVNSAVTSTKRALKEEGNGKSGVVVQAKGTGLSISLSMYVNKIIELQELSNHSIVILVDMKSLEDQLRQTISDSCDIPLLVPDDREELTKLLIEKQRGVILTTIQKFYVVETVNTKIHFVCYNILSNTDKFYSSLSFGSRILFCDNPSDKAIEFFGDIVGTYDLRQAMIDEVVKPIKVEHLGMTLGRGDGFDDAVLEVVPNLEFLEACAVQIIEHYELRQSQSYGKGVVIVKNLYSADAIEECIFKLRPNWRKKNWNEKVVCKVSSRNSFDETNYVFKTFRDRKSSLSLIISTGAFLTGYENSCISTAYVTCPISNQLQYQLAGMVSRYDKNKSDGLIVDFMNSNWSFTRFSQMTNQPQN